MSLLDAFLNEPFRDPREIWIALRTDGDSGSSRPKGSGRIDDPYDGGTHLGATLSATLTCNRLRFIVGTQFAHGLLPSDVDVANNITLSNARGPSAALFTGIFTLKEIVSPRHIVLEASALPDAPPNLEIPGLPASQFLSVTYPSHAGNQNVLLPTTARVYWPVAKVTTNVPHGFRDYEAVRVAGVDATYAGDHVSFGADDPTGPAQTANFWFRLSTKPGVDQTTPLACTAARITHRLDQILAAVPESSVLHLGPGTFESRGASLPYVANPADYTQLHVGHIVRPRQRYLGSGIGATTIKLVLPIDAINQTSLLSHFGNSTPNVDFLTISDLSLDCNAPGHVAPFGLFPAPVTCGAINVAGSFIRIERVRAIHFCVQARAECFAIYIAGGVMNVIEDCVVERPGLNNTHESTLLFVTADVYANARASIVRRNYVNCSLVKPNGSIASSEYVAVASITQQPGEPEKFVLVTKRPHLRDGPMAPSTDPINNVLLNGITPFSHQLNGSFPVVQRDSEDQLVFRVVGATYPIAAFNYTSAFIGVDFHGPAALGGTGCVVEGNKVFDCARGLYTDTGSTRDVVVRDNYYSGMYRGVDFDFNPSSGGKEDPRFAKTGVNINTLVHLGSRLAEASCLAKHGLVNGDTVTISGARFNNVLANGSYNGTYPIAYVDEFKFRYLMANDPPGTPVDTPVPGKLILVGYFSLTRDANNPNLVFLETAEEHGLRRGEAVEILGVLIADFPAPDGTYNGVYTVEDFSPTAFSYIMRSDPGTNADPSDSANTIRYRSYWQVRRLVSEQNAVDLYRYDTASVAAEYAFLTHGYEVGPVRMFTHGVIRENWVRLVDGGPLPVTPVAGAYLGLRLDSCQNHLIEGNVIDLPDQSRINLFAADGMTAFNNATPAGRSMPLSEDKGFNTFAAQESLEDRVAAAVALSLL